MIGRAATWASRCRAELRASASTGNSLSGCNATLDASPSRKMRLLVVEQSILIYQCGQSVERQAPEDMDPHPTLPPTDTEPRRMHRRPFTAASAICAELRDEIVSLGLEPGAALSEKDLTARFGVSRTPIREALIRLSEEGLVDIRPQAGTFVARIPLSAIPEAVVVRQAHEGALVEMAAKRAGRAGADALSKIIERQEAFARLGDQAAFHEADEGFHEAIATLSGHAGIWKTVRQAKLQIDRCRRLTLPALGRMGQVIGEHRVIADAIRDGNAPAARTAMQAHLQAVLPDARILARLHPAYFT